MPTPPKHLSILFLPLPALPISPCPKCSPLQLPLCCNSPTQTTPATSPSRRRPYGYWKHCENIHAELHAYVSQKKLHPIMPTHSELVAAGRADLAGAIRRYGPWGKTAEEAGLVLSSIAKPRSLNLVYCTTFRSGRMRPYMYWRNFDNLKAEIQDYLNVACEEGDDCKGFIPKASDLEAAGRSDLVRAIGIHGGWEAVADKLNMQVGYRTSGYWSDFGNVAREVSKIARERSDQVAVGTMPSLALLKQYGQVGLFSTIMRRYGGAANVAKRMGLEMKVAKKPKGFWKRGENLHKEVMRCLREICEAHPERDTSTMPSFPEFNQLGRSDLYAAIERAGGLERVAKRLSLDYSPVRNKHRPEVVAGRGSETCQRAAPTPPPFSTLVH